MNGHSHHKTPIKAAWTLGGILALLTLGVPLPAVASLGAYEASVQDDQVRLGAKVSTSATESYTIHELTSSLGTVVREYVSSSGRVFAVSWRGPFLPDMKQILGSYFGPYSVAMKEQRESQARRSPMNINKPSLVFQNSGHMRAYFGRAYDPQLLPAGVNADDLR
jgi:Protein of unknown function (DUF2844)